MNSNESIPMRDEKYDNEKYPQWLCEVGRELYDSDLGFRMNCDQHGHDSQWRRILNREAERLANPD